jgi:CDP-paratose synthetase
MNILITGATGYLGKNILKFLLNYKKNYITIIINKTKNKIKNKRIKTLNLKNLSELKKKKFNIILHLATKYNNNYKNLNYCNIKLPLAILKYVDKLYLNYYINFDTTLNQNLNIYSKTKFIFLKKLKKFSKDYNYKVINIKLCNFFGPNHSNTNFPALLIRSCLKKKYFNLFTDGLQTRYFLYINDVMSAVTVIYKNLRSYKLKFNETIISGDQFISIKNFCYDVKNILKSDIVFKFNKKKLKNEQYNKVLDNNSILKLGWRQKFSLENSIKNFLLNDNFYKSTRK